MGWPAWVDEIARRYLADEASVFVVHGDWEAKVWTAEDGSGPMDASRLLIRFLRRTREIVAVLHPGPPPARLEFAEYTDRGRFETLVRAADVLAGKSLALSETDPHHCLARIWRALGTVGTAQSYIVVDTERLLPAAKKHIDPVPGAPALAAWAREPVLRRSNNIVVLLCKTVEGVRADLIAGGVGIVALRDEPARARPAPSDLTERPTDPAVTAAADEGLGAHEVGVGVDAVADADAPPRPPPSDGNPLTDELEAALVECLGFHGEESRPARVPVMDAVARVIEVRAPGAFGPLRFSFDAEAGVQIDGAGADPFREAWRSDIALDASAGMILGKLPAGYKPSGATTFDATGMKALTRRVERLLTRLA